MFADVFDPLIQEYHGIAADSTHTSDMDATKIKGTIDPTAPVHSTRIRVGRNIDGFGLSPGITKDQRVGVENLMKKAFANLSGDLAGTYYPLTGMAEAVRQQLVDDHFLFVSGDRNLKVHTIQVDVCILFVHGKQLLVGSKALNSIYLLNSGQSIAL